MGKKTFLQRHRFGELSKVFKSHHRLDILQSFHSLHRHQSLDRMPFRIPSSSFRLISKAFFPASLIEAPMW